MEFFNHPCRILATLLLASFSLNLTLFGQEQADIDLGYMRNEVILKLDPNMSRDEEGAFLARYGFTIKYRYPLMKALHLKCTSQQFVPQLVAELKANPKIVWAQANSLGRRSPNLPNDSNFGNSYALNNTGQTVASTDPGSAGADLKCGDAWTLITDASNVISAIVDSGCRMTHNDLTANIWINSAEIPGNGIDDDGNGKVDDVNGWDFLGNDNNPSDLDGHGTNVTGTAFMVGNNSFGSSGVCWQASAMILKDGDTTPQVALSAAAIEYAAMMGAQVCNFSTGYGSGSMPALQNAVNVAETAGMIICVAAGNSGTNLNTNPDAPATYTNSNLLVVAASDNDDDLANFSNFGNVHCDVAAPGVNIYTTRRNNNSSFSHVDGTSFSAPLATGCVALMRAYNGTKTHSEIISAIIATCDVIPSMATLIASQGRINLFAALQAIGAGTGPTKVTPDPMTFLTAPKNSLFNGIEMAATTATSSAGNSIEYYFELVSSTNTGGNSSGWTPSSFYFDGGLLPDSTYSYRVKARDSIELVESAYSMAFAVQTPAVTPGLVHVRIEGNDRFEIEGIDEGANPAVTTYAINVNGQWLNSAGQLQNSKFFLPEANWIGVLVKDLPVHSTPSFFAVAQNLAGLESNNGSSANIQLPWLSASASGEVGKAAGGASSEDIFVINGQNGGAERYLHLPTGSPFTMSVSTPLVSGAPVDFALVGWIGVPTPDEEFAIPAPFGRGRFCFTPCDIDPSPGLAFNVISSFGPSLCGELLPGPTPPTPWFGSNPGYPFPLGLLTFQALVMESPGQLVVGNAILMNYN